MLYVLCVAGIMQFGTKLKCTKILITESLWPVAVVIFVMRIITVLYFAVFSRYL